VVRANFARLQESLRSMEEFSKLAMTKPAGSFKQLRYRVYTLERVVEITRGSIERLAGIKLYVLVDGRATPEDFERLVLSLTKAGVQAIQLRDKQLGDRELLARARLLRTLTREAKTLCIVNDRPDLAALAQADGVHVGQEEIQTGGGAFSPGQYFSLLFHLYDLFQFLSGGGPLSKSRRKIGITSTPDYAKFEIRDSG